jgi:hypothetical protein
MLESEYIGANIAVNDQPMTGRVRGRTCQFAVRSVCRPASVMMSCRVAQNARTLAGLARPVAALAKAA